MDDRGVARKETRSPRRLVVFVAKPILAAGLVVFVISRIDLYDRVSDDGTLHCGLIRYCADVDIGMFVSGAVLHFLAVSIASVRWWWLLRATGNRLRVWHSFRLTWIGAFWNNVFPGSTGGDVVKVVVASRVTGSMVVSACSVAADRIIGLLGLILLATTAALFQDEDADVQHFVMAASAIGVLFGLGVWMLLGRKSRIQIVGNVVRKLPLGTSLAKVVESMGQYGDHRVGCVLWIAGSCAIHGLMVLSVMVIGMSLHSPTPISGYFSYVPIIDLASALPLTPSGIGVGEAMYEGLWRLRGTAISPEAAQDWATNGTAVSLLYRLQALGWSVVGAAFMLMDRRNQA